MKRKLTFLSSNGIEREFDNEREHLHRSPEQQLLTALMLRAILDTQLPFIEKKYKESAVDWLMDKGGNYPFSFNECCFQLGYDIGVMRRAIKEKFINNMVWPSEADHEANRSDKRGVPTGIVIEERLVCY